MLKFDCIHFWPKNTKLFGAQEYRFYCCTMVRKTATTNMETKSQGQRCKKQAGQPTKPFFLFVRMGRSKKYGPRKAIDAAFQKMDWSKLNWRGVHGFEPNGYGCTAESFIAHKLIFPVNDGHNWALLRGGSPRHNWAQCQSTKVISNFTRLDTLASGTKVEYWRVSDLPKRLQSNCCRWGGEY